MKKTLSILALTLAATAAKAQYHYDANNDGVVNGTDITLIANYVLSSGTDAASQAGLCPDANHPHEIDMGVAGKWACCNVGANTPFQSGNFYAWGEKEAKSEYSDNYAYYHDGSYDDLGDISGNDAYDVAAVKWTGTWKLPTQACLNSLLSNCFFEATTMEGVAGILLTAQNGNRIFLPAAGYRFGTGSFGEGSYTGIWSSTPDPSNVTYSIGLDFYNGTSNIGGSNRMVGIPVRPVAEYVAAGTDNASVAGLCPDANHPHIIDMGEAGKWACCNVGAEWPFGYGNYYAWGETATKTNYTQSTYSLYANGAYTNVGDYSGNATYDAATALWGGRWKTPTLDRLNLLFDKCTYEFTTLNRISGGLFTATNGNKLFLPATGIYIGSSLSYRDSTGYYWSSTPYTSDGDDTSLTRAAFPARISDSPISMYDGSVYGFFFSSSKHQSAVTTSYYGRSVRPFIE